MRNKFQKLNQYRRGLEPINKGKTFEQLYGIERANKIKVLINKDRIGKTYEEIFGVKKAKEIKEKISKKLAGMNHPFYNKHLSPETKLKLRNSHLGKNLGNLNPSKRVEVRIKISKNRSGIYHTKATKEKIRIKRLLQITPKKDTKIEVKIQNYLKELKIDFFTHQYMKDIEHSYQCDILIPSMSLIIECDGDYWHKYPIGRGIDHIRTKELLEKGFRVLRLWENEIKEMNIEKFKGELIYVCQTK